MEIDKIIDDTKTLEQYKRDGGLETLRAAVQRDAGTPIGEMTNEEILQYLQDKLYSSDDHLDVLFGIHLSDFRDNWKAQQSA